jgi:hypothetical protein
MSSERNKERIIELIRKMRNQTFDRGCTPSEAAGFAAKVAEWIEKYQISEAELNKKDGEQASPEIEVCQNVLRTGKKAHNPGITAVVNNLSIAMCCKCIMFFQEEEAVYGVVGDSLDADYVCQIALTVIPSLQMMAGFEGREHGCEKASLVRWTNQYLMGAAEEIRARIEKDRRDRAGAKQDEYKISGTAIMPVTGITIANIKKEVVAEAFRGMYPHIRTIHRRARPDYTARDRGREAGKRVGLNISLEK